MLLQLMDDSRRVLASASAVAVDGVTQGAVTRADGRETEGDEVTLAVPETAPVTTHVEAARRAEWAGKQWQVSGYFRHWRGGFEITLRQG